MPSVWRGVVGQIVTGTKRSTAAFRAALPVRDHPRALLRWRGDLAHPSSGGRRAPSAHDAVATRRPVVYKPTEELAAAPGVAANGPSARLRWSWEAATSIRAPPPTATGMTAGCFPS